MIDIAIAFVVGTLFGTGMTCCFVMAGRADKDMENDMLESKKIEDESDIS